jgi:hypothetical protein
MKEVVLIGTTNASGAATITGQSIAGLLQVVEWVDGDLADGVDASLTFVNRGSAPDLTGFTFTDANDDKRYYPRVRVHDTTGADVGFSDGSLFNYFYTVEFVSGTPTLSITSGGNAKTGGCILYIEEF